MATCELCGEPMPPGEEMFKFHGYSGSCPKEPSPERLYQLRVLEERKELGAKLEKLAAFLASNPDISDTDRNLLIRQNRIMQDYSAILAERIAHF